MIRQLLARQEIQLALKVIVIGAVVLAVAGVFREAWSQLRAEQVTLHPLYAAFAAVAYLAAMGPMAWYWGQMLKALGHTAPRWAAAAAFYVSQIGKYVPGKATVILIRVERMLAYGGSKRRVVIATFVETLTGMAVAGVLSALLLALRPTAEGESRSEWLVPLAILFALGCLLPTLPPITRKVIDRLAPATDAEAEQNHRGSTWGLMLEGWIAGLALWIGFGVSLWLCALSVGAAGVETLRQDFWVWVLASALPTLAGFLSFLPAGALVRDGLTLVLLAPAIGEAGALTTTIAFRIVSIVAEVAACAILVGIRRR